MEGSSTASSPGGGALEHGGGGLEHEPCELALDGRLRMSVDSFSLSALGDGLSPLGVQLGELLPTGMPASSSPLRLMVRSPSVKVPLFVISNVQTASSSGPRMTGQKM